MRNTRRLQATSYISVTRCHVLLGDTKGKAVGTKRSLSSSSCGSDRRRLGIMIFILSIYEDADLHEVENNFVYSLYFSVYYIMKKRRWWMIGAKGCFRTWEVRGRKRCVRRASGGREERQKKSSGRARDTAIIHNCTSRPTLFQFVT